MKADQPQEMLDWMRVWCKNPKGYVLFAGQSGRGKTYFANECLEEAKKYTENWGRFINISKLYLSFLECHQMGKAVQSVISGLLDVPVLVIDDLGQRTPTEGFLELIYVLIDSRTDQNLGTIVTTNLTAKEMELRLGSAIRSRVCSGKIFKFDGVDRRVSYDF